MFGGGEGVYVVTVVVDLAIGVDFIEFGIGLGVFLCCWEVLGGFSWLCR